jgi:hypothetical protein
LDFEPAKGSSWREADIDVAIQIVDRFGFEGFTKNPD